MESDRWRLVERLYHAALARPQSSRDAYLAEACAGDAALRREVETLLAAPSAPGFLSTPAFVGAWPDRRKPSLAGQRLGVYELLDLLGAGGMGEVYRARDTRLRRDVAIKMLPQAFVTDPERRTRFEREARMLAALNHPNIGAIYGLEEADTSDAAAVGLVLELVEGETLAERLRRGPLPVSEALGMARQMADALDAAHEKGIVHRDLKPANIKITPAGVVKVLDFGLAKTASNATSGALSESPTVTVGGTAEGVIAGTVAYMSPEQARGQAIDKRTDIWAFGCVLYEMLTGRSPFAGETISDTIASVLNREPDWTTLPAGTPTRVRQLLERCLTKNPTRRLRDVGDAALDLDASTAVPEAPTAASSTGPSPSRRTPVSQMARAVGLVALGVIAGLTWRGSPFMGESTLTVGPMTRLTSDSGLATDPSISANGGLVAYASNRSGDDNLDIYVQQATGGPAIRLTADRADDHDPNVSPDGAVVAFRSERSPAGIYVASALGGGARLIAANGMAPRFSPDGRSIAFWTGPWIAPRGNDVERHVVVIPSVGGVARRVATNIASAGDPVWAPDGRSLMVFGRLSTSGNVDPDWWWVPLETGAAARTGAYERFKAQGVTVDLTDLYPYPRAWTSDGVFFTGVLGSRDAKALWLLPVNQQSGRPTGDAVRLTNGTTTDAGVAVARDGRMVFSAQDTSGPLIFALPLDANAGRAIGALRRVRGDVTPTGRTSVSDDGRLLVFPKYEFGAGGVWLRDQQTGQERQLVATPPAPLNPVVSGDGRWAAYTVTQVETGGSAGPGEGYIIETTGGVPRKICESCEVDPWTKDNRQVVIHGPDRKTFTRLDIASGDRIPLVAMSAEVIDRPMFGPAGRWLTFNSSRKVYVAPVYPDRATPNDEWMTLIDLRGGGERTAGLSPDGSLLYLLLERDEFRCLYGMRLDSMTGRRRGDPFLVAHLHDATRTWGSTGVGSAVAPGIFLANLFEATGNIWMTQLQR